MGKGAENVSFVGERLSEEIGEGGLKGTSKINLRKKE